MVGRVQSTESSGWVAGRQQQPFSHPCCCHARLGATTTITALGIRTTAIPAMPDSDGGGVKMGKPGSCCLPVPPPPHKLCILPTRSLACLPRSPTSRLWQVALAVSWPCGVTLRPVGQLGGELAPANYSIPKVERGVMPNCSSVLFPLKCNVFNLDSPFSNTLNNFPHLSYQKIQFGNSFALP